MANPTSQVPSTIVEYQDLRFYWPVIGGATVAKTYQTGEMIGKRSDGYCGSFDDSVAMKFLGLCEETVPFVVDASNADGDRVMKIVRPYRISMPLDSGTVSRVSNIESLMYAADSGHASLSSGSFANIIGTLVDIEGTNMPGALTGAIAVIAPKPVGFASAATSGAITATSLTGDTDPLTLLGLAGSGATAGGLIESKGGAGGTTGNGGASKLTGGAAGSGASTGGAALVTGGIGGATSGVGGAATIVAGAGAAGNSAGGVASVTGGAGQGSAAGGIGKTVGGAGGATGAGGAAQLTGGAGGATSGTGGAATIVAGAGTNGNAAGGVASMAGGAGNGTGAGGATSVTGGASGAGATGNGGAASITGGAAASTNGTGGATSVIGGVATGTGTGGAVTITAGASAGAGGTAGSVTINCGAAAGGTAGTITIGGTNACNVVIGASSFFQLPQTAITTEGFIWYDASAHTLKYRDNSGAKTVTAS